MTEKAKFFRILAAPGAVDRWFPDEPFGETGIDIDARSFTGGEKYAGPLPVLVPLATKGAPREFTLGAFDMPIVTQRVGELFSQICPGEIQRFPVKVGTLAGYEILNVVHSIDCLDENLCEVAKWRPEDGRPEKIGEYRMVTNLTIDPSQVADFDVFRVKGWEIALIVSERVKDSLEGIPNLGIVFQSVS